MVAQRARGINLPLMAVQDYLERDLVVLGNPHDCAWSERNIATRTELDFDYDTVVVDLDDTLILDGYAVPQTMAFITRRWHPAKRSTSFTRHRFDVAQTLARAHVDIGMFDRIVVVGERESKADHITTTSIFIDNHFPERWMSPRGWDPGARRRHDRIPHQIRAPMDKTSPDFLAVLRTERRDLLNRMRQTRFESLKEGRSHSQSFRLPPIHRGLTTRPSRLASI